MREVYDTGGSFDVTLAAESTFFFFSAWLIQI